MMSQIIPEQQNTAIIVLLLNDDYLLLRIICTYDIIIFVELLYVKTSDFLPIKINKKMFCD